MFVAKVTGRCATSPSRFRERIQQVSSLKLREVKSLPELPIFFMTVSLRLFGVALLRSASYYRLYTEEVHQDFNGRWIEQYTLAKLKSTFDIFVYGSNKVVHFKVKGVSNTEERQTKNISRCEVQLKKNL